MRNWVVATIGCAVFAAVYNLFGHGVHSVFMDGLFLIPLIAGVGVSLGMRALWTRGAVPPSTLSRQAYRCAVACLICASALQGIFQIAGTGSHYLAVYIVGACVLGIIAAALWKHDAKHAR